jgi:hypothetical protein
MPPRRTLAQRAQDARQADCRSRLPAGPITKLALQQDAQELLSQWAVSAIQYDEENPVSDMRKALAISILQASTQTDPEMAKVFGLIACASLRSLADTRIAEIEADRAVATHAKAAMPMFQPAVYDAITDELPPIDAQPDPDE